MSSLPPGPVARNLSCLGWWPFLPTWLLGLIYSVFSFLFPRLHVTTPDTQNVGRIDALWPTTQLSTGTPPLETLDSQSIVLLCGSWDAPPLVLYATGPVQVSGMFSSLVSTVSWLACISLWLFSALVKSHPTTWGHSLLSSGCSYYTGQHIFNSCHALFWETTLLHR